MSKIKTYSRVPKEAGAYRRTNPLSLKTYQEGKIGYILLWLIGIPIPIIFLIFLLRGCE